MPTNFSDKQLVAKSQQGDKRAFDMLVMRYQNRLSAVISRYCKSSLDTEDIVQESFIKAYRGIGNFRGDSAFYTWLCRIGINVAKNHLISSARHLRASETSSSEEMENNYDSGSGFTDEVMTAEGNIFGDELIDIIQSALSSLPEELRIALTLREIEGLSYDDISSMMACPIGTVRSRIFRAREVLNLKIKEYMQT
tara:strand:- start:1532 stop:2119 length:588 start_codon:yes stop_codon:yes gene_type:complete